MSKKVIAKTVLGIDPGRDASTAVLYNFLTQDVLFTKECSSGKFRNKFRNKEFLDFCSIVPIDIVILERVTSNGSMKVKHNDLLQTAEMVGKIQHCLESRGIPVILLSRRKVHKILKTKDDGDVRRKVLERFGEQGTKKCPGPTYGFAADIWQAAGVILAAQDLELFKVDGRPL